MAAARAHFRLAGTPVRVEPAFWVIVVLFGFNARQGWSLVLWVAIVFVSILLHEFGHATAYRAFGQRASIVLHGFAGLTFGQRGLSRGRSIVVSLAGPLSALFILGLPAKLLLDGSFGDSLLTAWFNGEGWIGWYIALEDVVFVNVVWSLANLLPIRPLDGGNVLSELIGINPTRVVSMVVAGTAALYAFTTPGYQFAGFFALMLGFLNYQEWKTARDGGRVASTFDIEPPAPAGARRKATTKTKLEVVKPGPASAPRQPAPPIAPSDHDLELQGWNALRNGDARQLRRVLAVGGQRLDPHLLGAAALNRGDTADGVRLIADAFARSEPPNLLSASAAAATQQTLEIAAALSRHEDGAAGLRRLQTHLHYGGYHREAALVGEVLHGNVEQGPQTSFEIACSWAQAGDLDRSFQWLNQAADEGFRAPSLVAGEPDLEPLRSDARWEAAAIALR